MPMKPFGLVAAMLVLTACDANQLYIGHDTVLGLNASVNSERSSGRIVFGYDRQFITLVPKSVDMEEIETEINKDKQPTDQPTCCCRNRQRDE